MSVQVALLLHRLLPLEHSFTSEMEGQWNTSYTTGSLSPTCAVNSISLKSNTTGTSVRSIRVVTVSIQATTVISITLIDICTFITQFNNVSTNISPTLAGKSISREACITAACVATYGVSAGGIAAAWAGSP